LIRLLKAADRAAVPWKNGGGITHDVIVSPAGATMDTFDWRVSIAEIAGDGPFSRFPGIDRKLAVLKGKVALTVEGAEATVLSPETAALNFHGESAVTGHLVDGPSTDLNVMTRRGRFTSKLAKQSAAQPKINTPASLIIALNPLTVTSGNRLIAMAALDALQIEGSASMTIGPKGTDYYLIEISVPQP